MAVQPKTDDLHLLKFQVFLAAELNQPQFIRDCLASQHPDVVKDVLHHCSTYEGKQTTPLILAAMKGHLAVVELLVNKYNVDVNQKVFGNFYTNHALLAVVCKGHLDIVKGQVRKGCDFPVAEVDGFTAVYIACLQNNMDVMKYLLENGAKIDNNSLHIGSKCLEVACVLKNREMVEYLLCKGANPNQRNDVGRTALHQAADVCASDLIRLLLHHGARLSKDDSGRSPLMQAALNPSIEALNVFLESAVISAQEKIKGLELRGATLAERSVDEAFNFVRHAMKERLKDPSYMLVKFHSFLPTLTNVQESRTLAELQARRSDEHLFRLECLAILSRILAANDYVTVHSYNAYSDKLQSAGCDGDAKAVFLHGMKATVTCNFQPFMTTQVMHLLSDKFVELWQKGMLTFFPDLGEIMESILDMLEKHEPLCFDEYDIDDNWFVYVLLALKVAQDQEEGRRLQRLMERFIHLTSAFPVLCTAVQFYWYRPDCLDDVDELPYDLLVSFLLQCGADVHAKDDQKNTALHAVARLSKNAPDCDLVSRITKTLLDAGALVGVKNNKGQTPHDLAGPRLAAELRELYPSSLKSLAATTVVSCNIDYTTEVPEDLAEFILKH